MSKRILYDATGTALKEIVVHDAETFTMVSHYDVDPLIAYAKHKRESGHDRKSNYREVATIPPHVVEQATREGWLTDKNAWARWFNDDQNKDFRTSNINRISGREGI